MALVGDASSDDRNAVAQAKLAMVSALVPYLPDGYGGILNRFNDDPATTDQHVFNLIDKALAELGALTR
ncbi:hypothetical protein EI067_02810 [Mycobacterium paragordonae]|nr:hypothetical protein [Mycobacterium paragordonae]TDL01958.1 hypothetical protein EI067_02810 [Mycobacterium paragordonae]